MSQQDSSNAKYLGIDLSSRHIRSGVVDAAGKIVGFRRELLEHAPNTTTEGRVLANKIITTIQQALEEQKHEIAGIGIGFPGLVSFHEQRVMRMPNAPSLAEINLYQEIQEKFQIPLVFENNTNAATLAEMKFGAAQGVSDWLYVRIGFGVGAGLVLDGKLRRGKSGYAGEIGHINIDPEGNECACGSRGCLETVASAPNIVRRTRERLLRDSTSSLAQFERRDEDFTYDDIVKAATDGDDLAILMMQRTGHIIGLAIADMINVLNLSMVVIAGNTAARPFLVKAIAEEARTRSFTEAFADCEIVQGKLASEAGVIGAAILAQEQTKK